MNKSIQVLIPTYNKEFNDIISLCDFWNLETDAIVAVQCSKNETKKFTYKTHTVIVVFSKEKGVSKNRNLLLSLITADIGVFIDDDCSMVDGYSNIICEYFDKYHCDCICFNGYLPTASSGKCELIRNKKDTFVKHFKDVSDFGAPGFSFLKSKLKEHSWKFDETIGTPNFIYAGEDSKFIFDVYSTKCNFYRANTPIFKIEEDLNNSSYFEGFDKPRLLITKGYGTREIRKKLFTPFAIYYSLKIRKRNNLSFRCNYNYFKMGKNYFDITFKGNSINLKNKIKFSLNGSRYIFIFPSKNELKSVYNKVIIDLFSDNLNDDRVDFICKKYGCTVKNTKI